MVDVGTVPHATLKNQISNERVIEKLRFKPLADQFTLDSPVALKRVTIHSPDLAESREGTVSTDKRWTVDPRGIGRYFVLECFMGELQSRCKPFGVR